MQSDYLYSPNQRYIPMVVLTVSEPIVHVREMGDNY